MTHDAAKKLLVKCNGRTLVVREVSDPLMEITNYYDHIPLPIINEIMSAEDAREYVKDLISRRIGRRTK